LESSFKNFTEKDNSTLLQPIIYLGDNMYIDLSLDIIPTQQDTLFAAKISKLMFGDLEGKYINLSLDPKTKQSILLQPVLSQIKKPSNPNSSYVFVAFQMQQPATASDLKNYVEDRHPALEKHGGQVQVSGLTERTQSWLYDGLELIEFPAADTVQALMADPDYRQRTATSSQVFKGAFAMAILTSILD
jgi:uncharacterized protein (DUF1330 family)